MTAPAGNCDEHEAVEGKGENLKVWVHDGIPFFYINILKFGGWGG